jgi:hypothetical protein
MNVAFANVRANSRIKTSELLDDSVKLSQVPAGHRQGVRRVEGGVEDRARNGRVADLEVGEKALDLFRGELRQRDDQLAFYESKVVLKPADFVAKHLADAAPG